MTYTYSHMQPRRNNTSPACLVRGLEAMTSHVTAPLGVGTKSCSRNYKIEFKFTVLPLERLARAFPTTITYEVQCIVRTPGPLPPKKNIISAQQWNFYFRFVARVFARFPSSGFFGLAETGVNQSRLEAAHMYVIQGCQNRVAEDECGRQLGVE